MYIVELDDDSYVTVSRSLLCMTEDQAKILREEVATSPSKSLYRADISLGEISFTYYWYDIKSNCSCAQHEGVTFALDVGK
jgi:uncharacterized protein YcfL